MSGYCRRSDRSIILGTQLMCGLILVMYVLLFGCDDWLGLDPDLWVFVGMFSLYWIPFIGQEPFPPIILSPLYIDYACLSCFMVSKSHITLSLDACEQCHLFKACWLTASRSQNICCHRYRHQYYSSGFIFIHHILTTLSLDYGHYITSSPHISCLERVLKVFTTPCWRCPKR